MTTIERTVTTTTPPEKVFAVPRRLPSTRPSGTRVRSPASSSPATADLAPCTATSPSFAGNEVELDYTVEAVDEPTSFTIVGRNDTTTSHDTIAVTPHAAGSTVVYRAEFSFTGVARLAGPLMKPLLDRLGDKTAEQLKSALDRL